MTKPFFHPTPITPTSDWVTAFAPATVANVAVGFDILGFALEGAGDRVRVRTVKEPGVHIVPDASSIDVPLDPTSNTAGVSLLKLIEEKKLPFGFEVSIHKGIPMGSGMGGSAASAVGAVVAANDLIMKFYKDPSRGLTEDEKLRYAHFGEEVASGSIHADNVAPCLIGGLCLVMSSDPPHIVRIDTPPLTCVLIHPDLIIRTKDARGILKRELLLTEHVYQSAHLAGFIAGCFKKDTELLRRSMLDLLIEPQRKSLIPGFNDAKKAALANGALGFSISGSGPSVFAWAENVESAQKIGSAVKGVFMEHELHSQIWISPLRGKGAHLV